jgi:hypothetical protein
MGVLSPMTSMATEPQTAAVYVSALLNTGMNQNCNVSHRGKRLFTPTQIYVSVQQHLLLFPRKLIVLKQHHPRRKESIQIQIG